MAFPHRQSGIQIEVIMSLLILLGTILRESEGIQCYNAMGGPNAPRVVKNCTARLHNACLTVYGNGIASSRDCVLSPDKQCMEENFGAGRPCLKYTDNEERTKCPSQPPDPEQGRQQDYDGHIYFCYCYTNLCNDDNYAPGTNPNPAGRSTPNTHVILTILGVILITGLGSI